MQQARWTSPFVKTCRTDELIVTATWRSKELFVPGSRMLLKGAPELRTPHSVDWAAARAYWIRGTPIAMEQHIVGPWHPVALQESSEFSRMIFMSPTFAGAPLSSTRTLLSPTSRPSRFSYQGSHRTAKIGLSKLLSLKLSSAVSSPRTKTASFTMMPLALPTMKLQSVEALHLTYSQRSVPR